MGDENDLIWKSLTITDLNSAISEDDYDQIAEIAFDIIRFALKKKEQPERCFRVVK
jgi:hypothetical protein